MDTKTPSVALAALLASLPASALAGTFDAQGLYEIDTTSIATLDFESDPGSYVPDDAEDKCKVELHTLVVAEDALEGASYANVDVPQGCFDRIEVAVPPIAAKFRARIWIRHGTPDVDFVVTYPMGSPHPTQSAVMGPTGRTTSDGWVEFESNEIAVEGTKAEHLYFRILNRGAPDGVHVDAAEVELAGDWESITSCEGVFDPSCQGERRCFDGRCWPGAIFVPPMPPDSLREETVDMLQSRLRVFFGGRRSRLERLPIALATLDEMRKAKTPFQFWDRFGRGVRELHDWHTFSSLPGGPSVGSGRVLNVCFIEGDADLSHDVVPKDPKYQDVLVSHVGPAGTMGLLPGDRLVAVDGKHPLEWMASTLEVDWGHHTATDPAVFADYAEDLGGPRWSGGAKLLLLAKEFSVIRCDPVAGTCNDFVETIQVKDLESDSGGLDVACDNRPVYSLAPGGNPSPGHYVFGDFFQGKVANTTDEEKIYGMIFDTLYGGGDPQGPVNGTISNAIDFWKANARGVIIDHRAGNGGTLDAPTNMSRLVRPEQTIAVVRMPIESAGFSGPDDATEGVQLFDGSKFISPYVVGASDHDPALPVALVLHRDGSASDYLPHGMKGAPKTKLFGPHATVGAFSTFIELSVAGGVGFQIASGDTITFDGQALIGHGVVPDVVVQQKQSDLLQGKDTIFEEALAWVRSELKPVP